jgi:hypothetical protein
MHTSQKQSYISPVMEELGELAELTATGGGSGFIGKPPCKPRRSIKRYHGGWFK